ncbi:MAG: UDP-N-acetylglucosamine 2-epimerase (non-hydrolyzing) [Magnetococcales bacterium]|nr:UDP-N-acetylglucosamine 2-epimerase (non-hydrolyzing) [Magnetococcales bacterium]
MKMAAILPALTDPACGLAVRLVHTGQHYDEQMNDAFFRQLGMPRPDDNLGVGSGSHAQQTAAIMTRFEKVVDEHRPRAILVVGDVNSTIACALVAAKKGVAVIHVEAGLRSYDRAMPEEINRVLTDQISDFLFTTERHAADNLHAEGIARQRVHFVGNVMIDTLHRLLPQAPTPQEVLAKALPSSDDAASLTAGGYGLVTMHRPSNVDDPEVLERLLRCLGEISAEIPLLFPVHPRTRARIFGDGRDNSSRESGLAALLSKTGQRLIALPPLGYLEMLGLMSKATLVLTDSGGIQEETTSLGVACITMRENTERPITVTEGTNTIVGSDPEAIRREATAILGGGGKSGRIPELWDGRAAERIAAVLRTHFGSA